MDEKSIDEQNQREVWIHQRINKIAKKQNEQILCE